jgi:sec-independent protein translocase protein TatB
MIVIACVAIIVVGPKELPGMLRAFGKTIGKIKRMAGDFQRQVDDAIKEADLDDVKNMATNKTFAPLEDAKKSMEEFAQTMKDPLEAHKSVVNDEIEAPAVGAESESDVADAPKKSTAKKAPVKKASAAKGAAKTSTAKPKAAPAKKTTARKTAKKTSDKAPAKSTS